MGARAHRGRPDQVGEIETIDKKWSPSDGPDQGFRPYHQVSELLKMYVPGPVSREGVVVAPLGP
jgi:hypothetical protein